MKIHLDINLLFSFFTVAALTVGSTVFVHQATRSIDAEKFQFSSLSSTDIDTILAVKAKMQSARIQASSSL